MKKILSIGDVHGRDTWKFYTHDSPYDFDIWRIAVENGASPDDKTLWKDMPFIKFDKIIFVGDYCDSFTIPDNIILNNLKDIIFLKTHLDKNVELLLGNHDVQYIVKNQWCAGNRPTMENLLKDLFNANFSKFKLVHEEINDANKKWLWSHAGITSKWYLEFRELYNRSRFKDKLPTDYAMAINRAWELKFEPLFYSDFQSQGLYKWAGPLWVRPFMFNKYPLINATQVVGHTPQDGIIKKKFQNGVSHYFIDCLAKDIAFITEV